MGALNFYTRDIYGNGGFMDTRTTTVPEAADQNALVDNQEVAVKNQVTTDPGSSRNMILGIGIVFAIIIFFSMGGKS